jgi:SAM-dependent methyltransferase
MVASGTHPNRNPTSTDYGEAYFVRLYGDVPSQTSIDKVRDRLVRQLVTRHSDGGRLLEIGCGFGYLLGSFADRWSLHGTDISAHAAAVAQQRLPQAHIVAADIQQGIPFSELFDVLIAVNVIEHLPDPAMAAQAIAGSMRTGGVFVAHLPAINNALNRWIYSRTYARDPTHVYRPSGVAFNRLFEDAGFEVLQALYCPFWPVRLWQWLKPHPAYLAVFKRM